jgi:hypothetical protein
MEQNKILQINQQKLDTSFINNQTENEFPPKFCNENSKGNSANLSLAQTNKSDSNNSKEKKKSNRYYQVRSISINIYYI